MALISPVLESRTKVTPSPSTPCSPSALDGVATATVCHLSWSLYFSRLYKHGFDVLTAPNGDSGYKSFSGTQDGQARLLS